MESRKFIVEIEMDAFRMKDLSDETKEGLMLEILKNIDKNKNACNKIVIKDENGKVLKKF